MLLSPKWETMWMESQHSSKTSINVPVPSQQAKKLFEDLRASCSSPNKAVQLKALKCWRAWINNQNQEDWKLNTVCYTAVKPLLTKILQPLQNDVDICKLRFSLMWALLRKVQYIMQLEGPQYILEVFVQSCFNMLASCAGDGGEEVTELIFQLLLAAFSKEYSVNTRDKEMFQPLSVNVFKINNVFYRLADKVLNGFVYWKNVHDKNVILKLWRHFLEHCELSYEHIAVPVRQKIFKLVCQICSEKSEPIKERLGFLHGCTATLKSVLSSSKFLDCGNLLLTPCEALFKNLMELCCSECEEFYDVEMFLQVLEVSKVLSVESVAIGGWQHGLNVLNLLDEFSLRSLYWGVWCGLVHCYESLLSKIDKNHFSKVQVNFYRKLRGIAINFDLDKTYLGEECIIEVERYIRVLNICPCACRSSRGVEAGKCAKEVDFKAAEEISSHDGSAESSRAIEPISDHVFGQVVPKTVSSITLPRFSAWKSANLSSPRIIGLNFDLINRILKSVDVSFAKMLLNGTYRLRFNSLHVCYPNIRPKYLSLPSKSPLRKQVIDRPLSAKMRQNVQKQAMTFSEEKSEADGGMICVRKTRSRKRAEEEERKKELENQKRKSRKSFEIRVQEIVQKNKERKTEKNCKKSPAISSEEKRKKASKVKKTEKNCKKSPAISSKEKGKKAANGRKTETPDCKLIKQKKGEKSPKLEKFFEVITQSGNDKKTPKEKGRKKNEENERKEEMNWKETSLVTMMIQGNEISEEGVRTRGKEKEAGDRRMKMKVIESSPLSKLSPFKEVLHDHEYARMEVQDLRALERVVNKEEPEKKTVELEKVNEVPEKEKSNTEMKKRKTERAKTIEGMRKSKRFMSETVTTPEFEIQKESETKPTPQNIPNDESVPEVSTKSKCLSFCNPGPESRKLDVEGSLQKKVNKPESVSEVEKVTDVALTESNRLESISKAAPEESQSRNCSPKTKNVSEIAATEIRIIESPPKEKKANPVDEAAAAEVINDPGKESNSRTQYQINPDEAEEYAELDSTPQRGKKRFRILDSLKPSKKLILEDPQEKLALEVEKENLEEVFPTKEEKSLKAPPKAMNEMISSRALKMIALLPESARGQVHWETTPRVEVKKKGPNVDKNSRASKMLALLSENVVREVIEEEEIKKEGVKSNGELRPILVKTPTSSLKSPKTFKQKRSIRFDDTKNETVMFETDSPPSQVLEGKGRCRRIQSPEVNSPICPIP